MSREKWKHEPFPWLSAYPAPSGEYASISSHGILIANIIAVQGPHRCGPDAADMVAAIAEAEKGE